MNFISALGASCFFENNPKALRNISLETINNLLYSKIVLNARFNQ